MPVSVFRHLPEQGDRKVVYDECDVPVKQDSESETPRRPLPISVEVRKPRKLRIAPGYGFGSGACLEVETPMFTKQPNIRVRQRKAVPTPAFQVAGSHCRSAGRIRVQISSES